MKTVKPNFLALNLAAFASEEVSSAAVSNLIGGGYNRSQRRDGACSYSKHNPNYETCSDGSQSELVDGCQPPCSNP